MRGFVGAAVAGWTGPPLSGPLCVASGNRRCRCGLAVAGWTAPPLSGLCRCWLPGSASPAHRRQQEQRVSPDLSEKEFSLESLQQSVAPVAGPGRGARLCWSLCVASGNRRCRCGPAVAVGLRRSPGVCRCCRVLELAAPVRSLPPLPLSLCAVGGSVQSLASPRRLLPLSLDRPPVAATCAGASGAGFRCVLQPAKEAAALGAPSCWQCGAAVAVVVWSLCAAVLGYPCTRCRCRLCRGGTGRPPWDPVAVAGACVPARRARRHCLALCCPRRRRPTRLFRRPETSRNGFPSGPPYVAAASVRLGKTSGPAQPGMLMTSNITREGGACRKLRLPRHRATLPAPRQHQMEAGSLRQQHRRALRELAPGLLPSPETWTREILEAKMNRLNGPRQSRSPFPSRRSRSFRGRHFTDLSAAHRRKIRRISSYSGPNMIHKPHPDGRAVPTRPR